MQEVTVNLKQPKWDLAQWVERSDSWWFTATVSLGKKPTRRVVARFTFHLHLLGDLIDVVLRPTVCEDHQNVGDPPPDSALRREDVLLHVLDGST